MAVDVRSSIVCDLVRTEDNGKQIIIGVYTGDIVLATVPTKLALTFWLECRPFVQNGNMEFELRLDAPGTATPVIVPGSMHVDQQETILIIAKIAFNVPETGRLVLYFRQKGKKWARILSKAVSLAPPAAG